MEDNELDSILISTKKFLGITNEYDVFDAQIVMAINTALDSLFQLGVGEKAIGITDASTTWDEVIGDRTDLNMVKTYVQLKVKMIFDPPTASSAVDAANKLLGEYEFRINMACDTPKEVDDEQLLL